MHERQGSVGIFLQCGRVEFSLYLEEVRGMIRRKHEVMIFVQFAGLIDGQIDAHVQNVNGAEAIRKLAQSTSFSY
jgi:hypothetical protein